MDLVPVPKRISAQRKHFFFRTPDRYCLPGGVPSHNSRGDDTKANEKPLQRSRDVEQNPKDLMTDWPTINVQQKPEQPLAPDDDEHADGDER